MESKYHPNIPNDESEHEIHRSGVFNVDFEHISQLVNFEHVIAGWIKVLKLGRQDSIKVANV